MNRLEIKIRKFPDQIILDMTGDLSGIAEEEFERALGQIDKLKPSGILLNFSDVDYINSTGISLVVRLLNKTRQTNQNVIAYGVKSYYAKIFEYTRISQYMNIHPDEETALSAMSALQARSV